MEEFVRCIRDEMDLKNKEIHNLNFNLDLNLKEI